MASIFETLNKIDVNAHTEKKGNLTYLSWAWAWAELKKKYPNSFYTIYEDINGKFYHDDGKTAWVKTGVTVVDGDTQIEHIEYLPVMDFKNNSVPLNAITSTAVNKTIQRSLTKAVARHGLGLYIYAGEDLPEDEGVQMDIPKAQKEMKNQPKTEEEAKGKCSEPQIKLIEKLVKEKGINKADYLAKLKINDFSDLTMAQATSIINKLKG